MQTGVTTLSGGLYAAPTSHTVMEGRGILPEPVQGRQHQHVAIQRDNAAWQTKEAHLLLHMAVQFMLIVAFLSTQSPHMAWALAAQGIISVFSMMLLLHHPLLTVGKGAHQVTSARQQGDGIPPAYVIRRLALYTAFVYHLFLAFNLAFWLLLLATGNKDRECAAT